MDRVDYHPLIVQDLLTWNNNEELNLNPWYQRRSVWTRPQKAYLINTLFEKKPVPTLYFRHSLDLEKDKSIREVVDGQQRIRSILEYRDNEFSARHPASGKRKKYEELSASQKRDFRETQLSGGLLLGANESDVIEVFGRLNSVSKTLNAQEKRNANYSGEFKQFCLKEAAIRLPIWRGLEVFSANDIARMNEIQFVADVALNLLQGLSDYNQTKLNQAYKKWDEDFPEREKVEVRLEKCFEKIASISPPAIKDTIFSRSPLFFSLLIVLDGKNAKVASSRLERALFAIDESFNADTPISDRCKAEADFYTACTASTQRIRSRRIRNDYIKSHL